MKFQYQPIFQSGDSDLYKRRPMMTIEMLGAQRSIFELALLDSGADISLCNKEIAELLSIDLGKAVHGKMSGIIGQKDAYITNVDIRIGNHKESITIPVAFIDSPQVGILLGQEGFFDVHKITFDRKNNMFEVIQY